MEGKKQIKVDILPEEEENIVTLILDDDVEQVFYEVARVDFDGNVYEVLQPVEDDEDEQDFVEVAIMRLEEKDGESMFHPIEDEELAEQIFTEFQKAAAELFGHCTCDECEDKECADCKVCDECEVDDCDCKTCTEECNDDCCDGECSCGEDCNCK